MQKHDLLSRNDKSFAQRQQLIIYTLSFQTLHQNQAYYAATNFISKQ